MIGRSIAQSFSHLFHIALRYLLSRWKSCGYHEIEGADKIEQNGMTLIPICCDIPQNVRTLTMVSSPSLLTAKEGCWYDAPQKEKDYSKVETVFMKLKRLKHKYLDY